MKRTTQSGRPANAFTLRAGQFYVTDPKDRAFSIRVLECLQYRQHVNQGATSRTLLGTDRPMELAVPIGGICFNG